MRFVARGSSLYLYAGPEYAGRIAIAHLPKQHELHPSGNVAFNVEELEVAAAAIQRCDKVVAAGKSISELDWS